MTKLEKFMKSTHGIAIGAILGTTLLPSAFGTTLQNQAHSFVEASFREAVAKRNVEVYYDESHGYVTPDTVRFAAAEAKFDAIKKLHDGILYRNSRLTQALEQFAALQLEVHALVVDAGTRIDDRTQLKMIAEVTVEWLADMKAGLEKEQQQSSTTPEVRTYEASSHYNALDVSGAIGNWEAKNFAADADQAEQATSDLREMSYLVQAENERLETIVGTISSHLDGFLKITATEGFDTEVAITEFRTYTDAIETYYDPPEYLGPADDQDNVAGLLNGIADEESGQKIEGMRP